MFALVKKWEQSGASASSFCHQQSIAPWVFRYWLNRYRALQQPVSVSDGLQGLVVNQVGRSGLEGEVYIFFNRRRTHVKLLVWDRSGFVIYHKRLERGTFECPLDRSDAQSNPNRAAQSIRWSDLQMIMEGIKLQSVQQRKRYERG